MDKISRIFGRKAETNQPDVEKPSGSTEQPVSIPLPGFVKTNRTLQNGKLTTGEAFGLKFIFETGDEFLFDKLPISIGRNDKNDLIIDDETISLAHALVYYDECAQNVCISDQDSLNGLLIDQLPTRKNVLHEGVTISLGRVKFRFRDTGYIHSHDVRQ